MVLRRRLLARIQEIAKRDGLDDQALAHCCRMARTRASTLLHGHIAKWNSETLIDVLARLGVTVELTEVKRQQYSRWNPKVRRPGWRPIPGMVYGIPPHEIGVAPLDR